MIRRLSASARRRLATARRLPRPWPFLRLLAVRPPRRPLTTAEVTLQTPSVRETVAHAGGGGRVVAVWTDSVLATDEGREAFERWHREVTNAGLLHAIEIRRPT